MVDTAERIGQCFAAWRREWQGLIRPGDWLLLLLATFLVVASFPWLWRGGPADRAIVRLDGRIVGEYALNNPRSVEVTGPLGKTVIEIRPGRARVLSDPGPRQYCVRQGWLSQANALAVCAPNHVSLSLAGRTPLYDTVSY